MSFEFLQHFEMLVLTPAIALRTPECGENCEELCDAFHLHVQCSFLFWSMCLSLSF